MALSPKIRLTTALWILLALPGLAFLDDGAATANTAIATGSTSSAGQDLSLSRVSPGGLGNGTASATVFGDMSSLSLSSSCSASSNNFQSGSNALAEVRVTDKLILNVPGLPNGQTVIAKIAYDISGNAGRSQSGSVFIQSLAAADSPLTSWRRETGNQGGPFDFDDEDIIIFEFPIKVNVPEVANVDLSIRAASACSRDPEGDPLASFSGNANANIQVDFIGMVDVTTLGGQKLYDWTVTALSGLDYGEGDPPPPLPAIPELAIDPSQVTPGDLTLSWLADPSQALIVQSSTNGQGWFQRHAISLEMGSLEIDPPSAGPTLLYRIISTTPTGPLSDPSLTIGSVSKPDMIRLSWPAEASETYRLSSSPDLQNWTEIQTISGASGLTEIFVPHSSTALYYRIENTSPTGPLSDPSLAIDPIATLVLTLLSWPAEASETYRIFSSPNLLDWTEIQVISGASGLIEIEVSRSSTPLYYRIEASFS